MESQDIDPERLRENRRRCGLTQRQLAAAIGVTLTSIQNYEYGRNGIPMKRLQALACALHCEPNDLLMRPALKA